MTVTNTHATIEELLEEVFSVRFVPRLYNEGQQIPITGVARKRRLKRVVIGGE
jgi:hypothetical protein